MAVRTIGRNDACSCGSGKKYKQCCLLTGQRKKIGSDLFRFQKGAAHLFAPRQLPATAPKVVPPGRVEPGQKRVIEGTAEHPFYVYGKGWTPLGELRPGDWIRTDNGWVSVDGVKETGRVETVYNVKVADHHTYFVGTPEWGFGVWAHNSNLCIDGSFFGKTPERIREAIPKGWTQRKAASGHGWVLVDETGAERVRYMYPAKNGKFHHESTGYYRRNDAHGNFLDVDGKIVDPTDPLFHVKTHIIPSGAK